MVENNYLLELQVICEFVVYIDMIVQKFFEFLVVYNINIILGSMLEIKDDCLYNVGYLCKRDGIVECYEKIYVIFDEVKVWGMQGGNEICIFDIDCGKIGVFICYDLEFFELSCLLVDEGMDILFVFFFMDM